MGKRTRKESHKESHKGFEARFAIRHSRYADCYLLTKIQTLAMITFMSVFPHISKDCY